MDITIYSSTTPPPKAKIGWQYGFCLGNNASGFDVDNLSNYSVAEVQFSVDDCVEDRRGQRFTPDGSAVGDYLRARDVDVVHYVAPFVTPQINDIGLPPGGREGSGKDPYWLMVEIAEAADKYGWWLPCRDGTLKPAFYWYGRKLYPLDTTNPDYRDWFVETVTSQRGERHTLRFDHGFTGWELEQYVKCPLYVHPDAWTDGQYELYDALRAEGWRVVVNQSWAPTNPREAPERWELPTLDHVDGIMAELAGSVYVNDDIRWLAITDDRRRALARICNKAGKVFVAWASWKKKRDLGFSSYDGFLRYHIGEAKQHGYRLAIHNADISGQASIWTSDLGIEKPAPLFPDHEPPSPPKPPYDLAEQVKLLSAQVSELQKRLINIETWITSFKR